MARRYRRKYRRRNGRRKFRGKSRRRNASNQRIARIPRNPFGKQKTLRHRYVIPDVVCTSPSAALPETLVFGANDMYDPETALGGHQPFAYDQMSVFFEHWTVIGFKIKVRARQNSNITTILMLCLDSDNTAITPQSAVQARLEQGTCKSAIMNGANQSGNTSITTLSYKCNPNKFLGIANPMSSSIVRGTSGGLAVGASPAERAFLKVVVQPTQAGVASVSLTVEMEYIAVWTEPKNGPGS